MNIFHYHRRPLVWHRNEITFVKTPIGSTGAAFLQYELPFQAKLATLRPLDGERFGPSRKVHDRKDCWRLAPGTVFPRISNPPNVITQEEEAPSSVARKVRNAVFTLAVRPINEAAHKPRGTNRHPAS